MPLSYAEIFESFPAELRLPIARLVDTFKEEFSVTRSDFEGLKESVQKLAEAQTRTEIQVARLEESVQKLTEAQLHTETRLTRLEESVQKLTAAQLHTETRLTRLEESVQKLAEAQTRTEIQVEKLAEAQKHTEMQVAKLAGAVEDLTQTQKQFRRTFDMQVGALGARWGLHAEEAFRQGMRSILQEVGFTTERFLEYDAAGKVFGRPDQIELDVVVKDGKRIVVEIKSSLDRGGTHIFHNKVAFYTIKTGQEVDRKLIIAPHVEEGAQELATALGIEICTDITELR